MGGHLNIVKYLVSITDTSFAPNYKQGAKSLWIKSPIYKAASMGHLDIVKYFVDTLSTPVLFPSGRTEIIEMIQGARRNGHLEVAKFLEEHCQDTFSD